MKMLQQGEVRSFEKRSALRVSLLYDFAMTMKRAVL
jgi:hypothetical protein